MADHIKMTAQEAKQKAEAIRRSSSIFTIKRGETLLWQRARRLAVGVLWSHRRADDR
jgi:hypothetical protein